MKTIAEVQTERQEATVTLANRLQTLKSAHGRMISRINSVDPESVGHALQRVSHVSTVTEHGGKKYRSHKGANVRTLQFVQSAKMTPDEMKNQRAYCRLHEALVDAGVDPKEFMGLLVLPAPVPSPTAPVGGRVDVVAPAVTPVQPAKANGKPAKVTA